MWDNNNFDRFVRNLEIKTRPNAGHGTWVMFLLPTALIMSALKHSIISTNIYKLSATFSVGLILTSLYFCMKSHEYKTFSFWNFKAALFTSLVFYIFLQRGIEFSVLSGFSSTLLFSKIYIFILKKFPNSFTLGEASIFSQSFIMLLYFTFINYYEFNTKSHITVMNTATIIIQTGLLGIFIISFLTYTYKIRNPLSFYITSIIVLVIFTLIPLHIILEESAIIWIINLLLNDLSTLTIASYWASCCFLAVLAVNKQIKDAQKASTSIRKIFHILSVAVYIPGLLFNCTFLYLASGVILGIFFALEVLRILNLPPLGRHLQDGMIVFGDEKDSGIIAFTPIYLLVGCSMPLWIHPAPCDITNSCLFNLLPLMSGVLIIGVGDTAASVVGSNLGKIYWPNSKKTIEGTIACIFSQIAMIYILMYLGYFKFVNPEQYARAVIAILVTSLVEAKTDQVDNLVLPLVMYIILI